MPIKILSAQPSGVIGSLIEVEVEISPGMPSFSIVGLTDTAIQESKERIRTAIKTVGAEYPQQKKIVNLAPASLRKTGSIFEMAIALGILQSAGQLKMTEDFLSETLFLGELSLSGEIKAVKGILPILLSAAQWGIKRVFIPLDNQGEATLADGIDIFGISHLTEILEHLRGIQTLQAMSGHENSNPTPSSAGADTKIHVFNLIHGQEEAKKALVVAAAGRHHLFMMGSPGVGKTLLARSLVELLPQMEHRQILETTAIYSAAGLLSSNRPIINQPPFREVHHTASLIALTGGGRPLKPGEITLSHHGVLFLDEMAEFPRQHLESLRQPLEDRNIVLSREHDRQIYPADFQLIAACNPCPCGYFKDPAKKCSCTLSQIQNYQKKLSGPLLDRFDLFVSLSREKVGYKQMISPVTSASPWENLQTAKNMILEARERQLKRYKSEFSLSRQHRSLNGWNSSLSSRNLKQFLKLNSSGSEYLQILEQKTNLSPRSLVHLLKTALTFADLRGKDQVSNLELAEAFQYRKTISTP